MVPENLQQFVELARPLIQYLCENHNPNTTIIITPSGAELLQKQMGTGEVLDYIKD